MRSLNSEASSVGERVQAGIHEIREMANRTAYVAIATAMMGALMFGLDQTNYGLVQDFDSFYDFWCKPHPEDNYDGFMTGGFPCTPGKHDDIKTPYEWTQFLAWGGSLITIGAAAGCISIGPLISSKCGRQPCISVGGLVCFIGCFFASYLTFHNIAVYYIGRFVTGFGAGICCFALPMYSSEVSTPSIRGMMGSLFQLMIVIGGVVASLALAAITDWRLGMLLPGLAGAIVGMLIWFTPESPRYVMERRGFAAGLQTLQKVRKGDCENEAREMQREADAEAEAGQVSYKQLFANPSCRRRVFIACYLQVAQQLTGVNAFLSYTTKIFESAGIKSAYVSTAAIIFNLLMLCGCIAGLLLIDSPYGGRRSQLLYATLIMGPPLVIAGIGKLLGWTSIISILALVLYGPGFQVSWGIITWLYPAEIFSMSEKDKAVSMSTFMVFAINFAVTYMTPILMNASPGWTFILFGALNVSNFVFVWWFVIETKGIPVDDVPPLFAKKAGLLASAENSELNTVATASNEQGPKGALPTTSQSPA